MVSIFKSNFVNLSDIFDTETEQVFSAFGPGCITGCITELQSFYVSTDTIMYFLTSITYCVRRH